MTVFFIFPHPDDETIFAGGTILRHVRNGDEVVWVCASYGERGGETKRRSSKMFYRMFSLAGRYPALLFLQAVTVYWLGIFRKCNMELAKIRKTEAEKVANILGVKDVIFLEITDMRFGWHARSLTRKLKEKIEEIKPDIVYTFHPNGITGHPDHAALSACVTEAVNDLKGERPRLFYVTFSKELAEKYELPLSGVSEEDIVEKIHLLPAELEKKREAIKAYESQSYLWKIFLEKYPEVLEKEYFTQET